MTANDKPQLWKTEEELESELEEATTEELVEVIKDMNKATRALPRYRYTKMVLLVADIFLYCGLMLFFTAPATPYGFWLIGFCLVQIFLLGDSLVTIYNLVQRSRGHRR